VLCASNPLSTQDDVAAALVRDYGIPFTPSRARTTNRTIRTSPPQPISKPHITMDDGADLVHHLHTKRQDLLDNVVGGTEETTTASSGFAPWPRKVCCATRSWR
jgi:adenosylhomocysteinase